MKTIRQPRHEATECFSNSRLPPLVTCENITKHSFCASPKPGLHVISQEMLPQLSVFIVCFTTKRSENTATHRSLIHSQAHSGDLLQKERRSLYVSITNVTSYRCSNAYRSRSSGVSSKRHHFQERPFVTLLLIRTGPKHTCPLGPTSATSDAAPKPCYHQCHCFSTVKVHFLPHWKEVPS